MGLTSLTVMLHKLGSNSFKTASNCPVWKHKQDEVSASFCFDIVVFADCDLKTLRV